MLQEVMRFTEERHEVLVNNISNFDTVGYKMKDLPEAEFQQSLQKALDRRESQGGRGELVIEDTEHIRRRGGRLEVEPMEIRDNNILAHDKNNRFVEKQMSALSQNALKHSIVSDLLRQQYSLLKIAISGRV